MYHFIVYLTTTIIRVLEFLFFARAIMSWLPIDRGSKISDFLYMVTEPVILPFRRLTDQFPALRGFPFDISFLLAFLALEMVLTLLYSL